jgi:hypothetical protein
MRSNVLELLNKINRLAQLPGFPAISPLEKDLLKQYLRDLYEAVDADEVILPPLTNTTQQPVVETEIKMAKQEQETLQPEAMVVPVAKHVEAPVIEPAKEGRGDLQDIIPSVKASINQIVKPSVTLNELIKTGGKEIHRKFAVKPLKEMIDMNRKFVFVNELFNGDADSFSKSIQYLDSLADYNEAFDYTAQSLSTKYSWNENAQPVRLFYKLLKQRFEEE